MTAPRLTVDHARSFEVPCRWKGEDAVLQVKRGAAGWWSVEVSGRSVGHPPVRSTPWLLRSSGRRRLAPSFPTFCERHRRRGDCGLDDNDANYSSVAFRDEVSS